MDFRQLRYFLEIVDQGSITRASKALNVAQPALSLHMRNMEAGLGTRLLERSRLGVAPTEAGELLARRGRMILDDLARTEEEIRRLDREPGGLVRIGLPGTISGIVALPALIAARERYRGVTVNIAEAMSGFIGDWLREGRVDLAVLYARAEDAVATSELLLEEELVVLWRREADLPDQIGLSELRGTPLVLPSAAHGLRAQIDEACEVLGFSPEIAIEIDSYANIKRLVAAGFGASILPLHAVAEEVRSGVLSISRIAAPGLWRGAYLIQPTGRPATRAQAAVRDLLREVILGLLERGEWVGARAPGRT